MGHPVEPDVALDPHAVRVLGAPAVVARAQRVAGQDQVDAIAAAERDDSVEINVSGLPNFLSRIASLSRA